MKSLVMKQEEEINAAYKQLADKVEDIIKKPAVDEKMKYLLIEFAFVELEKQIEQIKAEFSKKIMEVQNNEEN